MLLDSFLRYFSYSIGFSLLFLEVLALPVVGPEGDPVFVGAELLVPATANDGS